jgi:malate dehydrogenase (quinone)
MSFDDRMGALRQFVKNAKNEGWEIIHAGQREQIIKKDDFTGGELPFGTEIISSKEGSITCVLDAAPRASTALYSMLQVLEKAFSKL